jgi:hypothetical protein
MEGQDESPEAIRSHWPLNALPSVTMGLLELPEAGQESRRAGVPSDRQGGRIPFWTDFTDESEQRLSPGATLIDRANQVVRVMHGMPAGHLQACSFEVLHDLINGRSMSRRHD